MKQENQVKWAITAFISLLAAGSGIVALLNYFFSPSPPFPTPNTVPPSTSAPPNGNQPVTGCTVYITNPLTTIQSEPDTFSQELIRVSVGQHNVLDIRETEFGSQQELWYQISDQGETGWVEYRPSLGMEKSPECP